MANFTYLFSQKHLSLLVFLCSWTGLLLGQTSVQDFGTGGANHTTSTSTTFLPNPTSGTTFVRIGTGGGAIALKKLSNPLGTTGSFVRGRAPSAGSVNKFSPIVGYTGSTEFYTSFKVLFADTSGTGNISSGTWYFFQGAGTNYTDANSFFGSQVFTGLRFAFGASGAITLNYRNALGAWAAPTTSALTQATAYTFEIVGNNTAATTINYMYSGTAQTVGIQKYDLYLNGTLIGDDLGASVFTAGANITSTMFYGENSTTTLASIFVDNIRIYNAIQNIALGARPSACQGITTANLPYTSTSGNPDTYSINYDATAEAAGFVDVASASLPTTQIALTIPSAAAASTYNGTVKVWNSSDPNVQSSAISFQVVVKATPPKPTITASGAIDFCDGSNVVLTSSATSGNQWYKNATSLTGEAAQDYTATTAGAYTVISTLAGCPSAVSLATNVTVKPIPATPTLTPTGPLTVCGSVVITSSYSGDNHWYIDGIDYGTSTSTFTATSTATTPGYTAAAELNGCASPLSNAVQVTVNAIPVKPIINEPSQTVCDMIVLTSDAAAGTSQWKKNGVNITGATGDTYTVTVNGSYSVISVQNGCPSLVSDAVAIVINSTPKPTVSPSGPLMACDEKTFSSNAATGTNEWYLDGSTTGETTDTYVLYFPGTYSVSVISTTNGCPSPESDPVVVTITVTPDQPIISPTSPISICSGTQTLTSTATTGNQWYKDGSIIAGATSTTYAASSNGAYTVISTIDGCPSPTSSPVVFTVGEPENHIILTSGLVSASAIANSCESNNGFTYYEYPAGSGNYIFAIDWKTNTTARDMATITIKIPGSAPIPAGNNDATNSVWAMNRIWNVDLHSEVLSTQVDIKFFFNPSGELQDVINAATAHAGTDEFKWVKTNNGEFTAANLTKLGAIDCYELTPVAPASAANNYVTGTEDGVNYVQFNGVGSFSGGTFVAGSGSPALPIVLKTFNATLQGTNNVINWSTASEKNVEWHAIERSADGITGWTEIGRLTGSKDSNIETKYTLLDKTPISKSYYRLRTLDFDGKSQLSHIVVVSRKQEQFSINSVYPVPTNNFLNLSFTSAEEKELTIQVTDLAGRNIQSVVCLAKEGLNQFKLDVNSLNSGFYLIKLSDGVSNSESFRVIKQ